ncbi:adenosine kinase [Elysia marginata]|uniref:Adenosine kinase n=1 Tax=Elysia marginata TaxID=1093978 RepID=A0AAV4J2B0_9GAST|nr:adenosine kinase [Elysia marginata]
MRVALGIHHWIKTQSGKACTVVMYKNIKLAYVASDSPKPSVKKYTSKFYMSRNVIDLYGCENAFAGGYAAQYIQDPELETCINCAFFCASAMATQMGPHFPVNRQQLLMHWKSSMKEDSTYNQTFKCPRLSPISPGLQYRKLFKT